MRNVVAASLLLALLPLATARAALAADAPPSEQAADASALFAEARRLMVSKDYEHARIKFLQVRAISQSTKALWNLAVCELESEHFVEATRDFHEYFHRSDADRTLFPEGRVYLTRAQAHIGQIQIALSGASAKVDSEAEYGASALADPIPVTPGRHHVRAEAGSQYVEKDVDVPAGATVTLAPEPTGVSSPSSPSVPATHRDPGSLPVETAPERPSTFTTGRKVAIGLGVAGVVVAGVGVGFAVSANNAINNADSLRATNAISSCAGSSSARCSNIQSAINTAKTDAPVSTGLFIGGGVLVASAIVVWLVTPPRPEHSAWTLAPTLDRTGAGFRFACDF